MRIAFITSSAPYGKGESFVLSEVKVLADDGVSGFVVPTIQRAKSSFNEVDDRFEVILMPLISFSILRNLLYFIITQPLLTLRLFCSVFDRRSVSNTIKNFSVLPKALLVANQLKDKDIDFIYCHWLSTPATLAMIVSKILTIPWGVTAHRGDIKAMNLTNRKVDSASFVRVISEKSYRLLEKCYGDTLPDHVKLIYLGTMIPKDKYGKKYSGMGRGFLVIADFFPVKGHKYFLDACDILAKRGNSFTVKFMGDGPLKQKYEKYAFDNIEGIEFRFCGHVKHSQIISSMRNQRLITVLPSLDLGGGLHEGVPVCLMEAMAFGSPVISTLTGGIPELVSHGTGLLVHDKSASQLANAMEKLLHDGVLCDNLVANAQVRVASLFCLIENTKKVSQLIRVNSTAKIYIGK